MPEHILYLYHTYCAFPLSLALNYRSFYYFYLFIFILGCVWPSLPRVGFFSSCVERGLLFVPPCGLLIAVASLVAEHGL